MVDSNHLEALNKLTLCHRKYLDKILNRPGPFTDEDSFMPGEPVIESLERAKIL